MKIFVNKDSKKEKDISNDLIKGIAEKTIEKLQDIGDISQKTNVEIGIAFVNESRIAELNQQYRQHNGPTDVLSFCYEKNKERLEGEIVVCSAIIKKNALEDKIEFKEELTKNIIHGILHIAGYEHGEEMFSLQDNILNKNKNEYQKIIK